MRVFNIFRDTYHHSSTVLLLLSKVYQVLCFIPLSCTFIKVQRNHNKDISIAHYSEVKNYLLKGCLHYRNHPCLHPSTQLTECTPVLGAGQIVDALPLPPDQLQHGAVSRGVARGPAGREEGGAVQPHPLARGVLGRAVNEPSRSFTVPREGHIPQNLSLLEAF